jgi:hypothetical protein
MQSREEQLVAKLQDLVARVERLESAVTNLTAEKKSQTNGVNFERVGGKKVGHPVSVRTRKEIDFSAIGGRCVRGASVRPMLDAPHEEPNKDEGAKPEETNDPATSLN